MDATKKTALPEPVIVPGIMELIRKNKERISLETWGMSYEEVNAYFERGRIENPIFPSDYELAKKKQANN
jgi:hypothetical protein